MNPRRSPALAGRSFVFSPGVTCGVLLPVGAVFQQTQAMGGIAMRRDKTARDYHAALCPAATPHWLNTLSDRS